MMITVRLLGCITLFVVSLLIPNESVSRQRVLPIFDLDWSADGNWLAVQYGLYSDSRMEIRDAATLEVVRSFDTAYTATTLDWHPGPQFNWLAFANKDGQIWVVGVDSGQTLLTMEDPVDFRIYEIAWSPDGQLIATGHAAGSVLTSPGGIVKIWDADTGELQTSYGRYRHTEAASALSWSPDGVFLASLSTDGSIIIWDSQTDQIAAEFTTLGYGWLRWSSDGTHFITVADDITLELWDAAISPITGTIHVQAERYFHTMMKTINDVEWRPGTSEIAVAADDTVIVMDTDLWEQTSYPASDVVWSVAWSPDGTQLAYGDDGGNLEVLQIR